MKMMFCVVPECGSASATQPHLAYHKFPSCLETKRIWLRRMKLVQSDLQHHTPQVCSNHFRKDDYLPYHKTFKRMLKKGAVPSSFPWGTCDPVPTAEELHQERTKAKQTPKRNENLPEGSRSTDTNVSDSGGISLDDSMEGTDINRDAESSKTNIFKDPELSFSKSMIESENSDHGSVTDASSVSFTPEKCYGRSGKHGESKYAPGQRLEAKDLSSNKWWKAKIVEVDWEDEEVLIHFEKWSNRFDEWIPMDSSRLRPAQIHSPSNQSAFRVGETVMASWTDNKKYAARIKSILSGDKYEVLFFDGFCKVVKGHKISKGTEETLAMDPGLFHNAGPTTMTKAERREKKRKIGSFAELFQMKRKISSDTDKSTSKKKTDSDKTKDESCPSKVSLSFDDRRKESEGKSRQRSFPVIKGFGDEEKARGLVEKKGKKTSVGSSHDGAAAGSSKQPTTPLTLPPRVRRRKRDDNIGPSDYFNWEPEGEEAWLVESAEGLRRSIKVKDDRLPTGWAKHTIQRQSGNSAGKWDVFLVSPTGRRFRSRKEMHAYFADSGEKYNPELFDFTLRCSMRRKSADTEQIHFKKKPPKKDTKSPILSVLPSAVATPAEMEAAMAEVPSVTRRVKTLLPKTLDDRGQTRSPPPPHPTSQGAVERLDGVIAEDRVIIGHLKIQTENDAFICPKEGCSKHFRKENLLQMHIKHYHPEYSKFMGSTPNVADLAYARTVGEPLDELVPKARPLSASFFEQVNRFEAQKKTKMLQTQQHQASKPATPTPMEATPTEAETVAKEMPLEPKKAKMLLPPEMEAPPSTAEVNAAFEADLSIIDELKPLPTGLMSPTIPKPTPTLPNDFLSMPVVSSGGIKTLLPVVRSPCKAVSPLEVKEDENMTSGPTAEPSVADVAPASASEVVPPKAETPQPPRSKMVKKRRLSDMYIETLKKRRLGKLTKCFDDSALHSRPSSQVPARFGSQQSKYRYLKRKKITTLPCHIATQPLSMLESPMEMSEPNGSPASVAPVVEEEAYEQLQKRDIINCTCGIMEEDGLMIQCDLCLCWQHVACNNSMDEEVPDKYVCWICLNPARERKSSHYLHDQYWLKDGSLPTLPFRTKDAVVAAKRESLLKQSHDLSGELLGYKDVLHSLRVKLAIAKQPDHPKLYLWAEKPTTSTTTTDSSADAPDIKQEDIVLPMKADLSATDMSHIASDLKLESEKVAEGGVTSAESVDHAEPIPLAGDNKPGPEGRDEPSAMVGGADLATQAEDRTKAIMHQTAVQDHTYVHITAHEERNTKQTSDPAEVKLPTQTEESLKLDTQILEHALTQGGLGVTPGDLAPELNAHTLIDATLDAATQNQLLQLPICRSELMRFANSMADNLKDAAIESATLPTEPTPPPPKAPQPEKPIDPLECRMNLLDQIEDFQEQLDARLALIEDQVSVLEAEDPEPPSEETATFYPQTKHTLQMINRDLVTMKKVAMTATGYTVVKW